MSTKANRVGSTGGSASGKPEMPEAVRKEYNEMLTWINESFATQSLLYDLNRLPEQLKEGSREWCEMVTIVQHMKAAFDEGKSSSPNNGLRSTQP